MKGTGKPVGMEESVRKGRPALSNSLFRKLDVEAVTVELIPTKG